MEVENLKISRNYDVRWLTCERHFYSSLITPETKNLAFVSLHMY